MITVKFGKIQIINWTILSQACTLSVQNNRQSNLLNRGPSPYTPPPIAQKTVEPLANRQNWQSYTSKYSLKRKNNPSHPGPQYTVTPYKTSSNPIHTIVP